MTRRSVEYLWAFCAVAGMSTARGTQQVYDRRSNLTMNPFCGCHAGLFAHLAIGWRAFPLLLN